MLDGSSNTYVVSGASLAGFVGQLLQMVGNATNVVRITHIDVSATAAAAAVGTVALQRFSTAATGGSPSGFNTAKNDTNNPSAQSSLVQYASAPTGGIPVGGNIRSAVVSIAATGTLAIVQSWDFGNGPKQGLILRGASDFMCLILGSGFAGSNVSISWEWTESTT